VSLYEFIGSGMKGRWLERQASATKIEAFVV